MATETETHDRHLWCRRCTKPFVCHVDPIEICQCNSNSLHASTLEFLSRTTWGCLCVECLKEIDSKITALQGKVFPKPAELQEGIHYYMENGLVVFTEYYHMLRGNCCQSGCRHCAYGIREERM